jgi:hypothetical protein
MLALGCVSEGPKDCRTSKECLKAAFAICENAHGVWEGQNGNIDVTIAGKEGNRCIVDIRILGNGPGMGNKNMSCSVPMDKNDSFEIGEDCGGELAGFFQD